MFIKSLKVWAQGNNLVRNVEFHKGINLIVDEDNTSGNNVGKTTALRLIDVCLGGEVSKLYADSESSKKSYRVVEEALKNQGYRAEVVLVDSLEKTTKSVTISRDFAPTPSEEVFYIDGLPVERLKFTPLLKEKLFPGMIDREPLFRSLISHNIRCEESQLSSVYKTLNKYASRMEYSVLYSAMFGVWNGLSSLRRQITNSLSKEKANQRYLSEQINEKSLQKEYKNVCSKYDELREKKDSIFLNESLQFDYKKLARLQNRIRDINQQISSLEYRICFIQDMAREVKADSFDEDLPQLKLLYEQAGVILPTLHADFEKLVSFHNAMLKNKADFITRDLPQTKVMLEKQMETLAHLQEQEKKLKNLISKSASMQEFTELTNSLHELSEKKGLLGGRLQQMQDAREKIAELEHDMRSLEQSAAESGEFERFERNVQVFNGIFGVLTQTVIGNESAFCVQRGTEKNGVELYDFDLQSSNHSTGNKASETFCFDLAYTLFAEKMHIPCLRFFLHDRKEVVDNKHMIEMARLAEKNNTQLVLSILRNRLPAELDKDEYIVLKLSQQDKFFKLP